MRRRSKRTTCLAVLLRITLTSALQSGRVVVLSGLAVTLVAAHGIQTEASFTHLLAKQCTLISICDTGGEKAAHDTRQSNMNTFRQTEICMKRWSGISISPSQPEGKIVSSSPADNWVRSWRLLLSKQWSVIKSVDNMETNSLVVVEAQTAADYLSIRARGRVDDITILPPARSSQVQFPVGECNSGQWSSHVEMTKHCRWSRLTCVVVRKYPSLTFVAVISGYSVQQIFTGDQTSSRWTHLVKLVWKETGVVKHPCVSWPVSIYCKDTFIRRISLCRADREV